MRRDGSKFGFEALEINGKGREFCGISAYHTFDCNFTIMVQEQRFFKFSKKGISDFSLHLGRSEAYRNVNAYC